MSAIVVANFDAEIEMAREVTPGPHPDLPAPVSRRLAAVAGALEVLAGGAVVVSTAAEVPDDAGAVLGWAETSSVAAARQRQLTGDPLWAAIASPEVVCRVNDRRFWLALARHHGWMLPETAPIGSVAELRARLPALVAASADGGWSVKAPLSAAGRERVHRWGAELPGDIAVRIERLIDRFGELIAEPWMPRVVDAGVAGLIAGDRVEVFAPHRLEVDTSGTFRHVIIDDRPFAGSADFAAAAAIAGDALRAAGYQGAFGIDGFVYRSPGGRDAIMAACEINARLTFGLVARRHREASGAAAPYVWRP